LSWVLPRRLLLLGLAALPVLADAAFARAAWADIQVFEDVNFRGRSVRVGGVVPDLRNYGFNDRISSIRVFDGAWEVCEHANFQGRCYVIDRDILNLGQLRMAGQISSIRPVNRRGGYRDWERDGRGWGK
jgi:hypothetical protein